MRNNMIPLSKITISEHAKDRLAERKEVYFEKQAKLEARQAYGKGTIEYRLSDVERGTVRKWHKGYTWVFAETKYGIEVVTVMAKKKRRFLKKKKIPKSVVENNQKRGKYRPLPQETLAVVTKQIAKENEELLKKQQTWLGRIFLWLKFGI